LLRFPTVSLVLAYTSQRTQYVSLIQTYSGEILLVGVDHYVMQILMKIPNIKFMKIHVVGVMLLVSFAGVEKKKKILYVLL